MLDGLLGRGFTPKCKSLIKLTKSRIDVIRRKRNATQKFLKEDIADLLFNGLDINAYGRAEGLMAELCLSSCYDFVEYCCDIVLKHLSVMQKLRGCPEDCKEAISSLMFAAARFSDLPELRDLRNIFYERYGNSLELSVNQKLVENLTSVPCTMEKKVRLMQDIATEFSVKWDSKGFELRMSKPSLSAQEQRKTHGSYQITDDKYKSINGKDRVQKGEEHAVSSLERPEHDGHKLHNGKQDNNSKRNESVLPTRQKLFSDACEPFNGRDETIPTKDNHDISLVGRGEVTAKKQEPQNAKEDGALKAGRLGSSSLRKRSEYDDGGSKQRAERENTVPRGDIQGSLPRGKPEIVHKYAGLQDNKNDGKDLHAGNNYNGQHNNANLTRNVHEQEMHKMKPFFPPPYVKPNVKPKDSKYGVNAGSSQADFNRNGVSEDPSKHNHTNACDRSEKIQVALNHPNGERRFQDGGDGNFLPKPRSVRRRHSKSRSRNDDVGNEDPRVVTRKSRSRRRDDSRRGLQILFDDEHEQNDEEERIIDKLLIHYSKKPSACEPGKVKRKSRSRHPHNQGTDMSEPPGNGNRDDDLLRMVPHPPRSISLPREQTTPAETPKVYARAASFQPDRSDRARHVHPNLPDDYDDLAARIAALKGR